MVIFSKSGALVVLVALLTLSRYSVNAAAMQEPPSPKPGTTGATGKHYPLPTIAESGVPGYDVSAWFGLFVTRPFHPRHPASCGSTRRAAEP